MSYTIEEVKRKVFDGIYDVYDIFKEFFGEDKVDLQNLPELDWSMYAEYRQEDGTYNFSDAGIDIIRDRDVGLGTQAEILVWWPEVRVTNENDKYVDIQDLYAKVTVNMDGCIPYEKHGFLLNRTRYPYSQWISGYMHSHISSIPRDNLTVFQTPCLGRGPIIGTINSLKNGFDEVTWRLFCQELDNYVYVESIAGVPYNRLENINRGGNTVDSSYEDFNFNITDTYYAWFRPLSKEYVKDFMIFYLKRGNFAISYQYGVYVCGMSWFDYILDVSKWFIKYFNRYIHTAKGALYNSGVLYERQVIGGKIYRINGRNSVSFQSCAQNIGKYVLTFKGERKLLQLDDDSLRTDNAVNVTLISPNFAMDILKRILKTINYEYGKESDDSDKRVWFV